MAAGHPGRAGGRARGRRARHRGGDRGLHRRARPLRGDLPRRRLLPRHAAHRPRPPCRRGALPRRRRDAPAAARRRRGRGRHVVRPAQRRRPGRGARRVRPRHPPRRHARDLRVLRPDVGPVPPRLHRLPHAGAAAGGPGGELQPGRLRLPRGVDPRVARPARPGPPHHRGRVGRCQLAGPDGRESRCTPPCAEPARSASGPFARGTSCTFRAASGCAVCPSSGGGHAPNVRQPEEVPRSHCGQSRFIGRVACNMPRLGAPGASERIHKEPRCPLTTTGAPAGRRGRRPLRRRHRRRRRPRRLHGG